MGKPYIKKYPKNRRLILDLITITEQVETLHTHTKKIKNKKFPKEKSLIPGSITITEQIETLY